MKNWLQRRTRRAQDREIRKWELRYEKQFSKVIARRWCPTGNPDRYLALLKDAVNLREPGRLYEDAADLDNW